MQHYCRIERRNSYMFISQKIKILLLLLSKDTELNQKIKADLNPDYVIEIPLIDQKFVEVYGRVFSNVNLEELLNCFRSW